VNMPLRMGFSGAKVTTGGGAISIFTDEEWQDFCMAIGESDLIRDAKFATVINRKKHENQLNELVEKWTSEHDAEDVMNYYRNPGVAAGIVENAKDLSEDPQLKEKRVFLGRGT